MNDDANANLVPVVGVGASAGGLEAFTQLLKNLPDDTGMAFVLIQHLDPHHDSKLHDLLARTTSIPVSEVTDGMAVRPNHVYIIPKHTNMVIAGGVLQLTPREETHQHLPIDFFFRSLAGDRQDQAIGIVLSGTGSDGTLGMRELKAAGAITFTQDEQSAKFPGMPQNAAAGCTVDFVLSPQEMGRELARIGKHPFLATSNGNSENHKLLSGDDGQFRKVITLLRSSVGVDFSDYRDTTIKRRIMRRMALHTKDSLADYVALLKSDRAEVETLFHEILINVTSFFRDPEMFEVLKSQVFPRITKDKPDGTPIRIWTAGCSTGQEAYSIAMTLLEHLENRPDRPEIQIFATDLSSSGSLNIARAGIYPESIEADVSPERLRRFFTKTDGKYRINESIRDLCVFAKQNVTADPPFSRVDLISCRNLLIYLAPALQKRVIPTFHYALSSTGFLMLGTSESIGGFTDLFEVVDKSHRIYAKKQRVFRQYPHFNSEDYLGVTAGKDIDTVHPAPNPADFQKEADRMVLGQYAPAGVLVNESFEILQFRGRTGPYLEPAAGTASLDLLKMARDGLFMELKSALDECKQASVAELAKSSERPDGSLKESSKVLATSATGDLTIERLGVAIRDGGQTREINLRISPVKLRDQNERCFLVLFEETDSRRNESTTSQSGHRWPRRTKPSDSWLSRLASALPMVGGSPAATELIAAIEERDRELIQLRRELEATRDQQQIASEQHDAANEELKSANEEILSSNEELQSTNEELETAKEELQSINEELTTVNDQLQTRNQELTLIGNDLTNLLTSASVPIVMLGSDLCIRRFTPRAGKVFKLLPGDVGRPIGDLNLGIEVAGLESLLEEVIATVQVTQREIRDREGHWHQLRLHPYRTGDNKIDGAVLVFLDIDAAKTSQLRLKAASEYTDAIVQTLREPLLILTDDLRIKSANQSFYQRYEVTPEETENQLIYELGSGQWDQPPLRKLLTEVLSTQTVFDDYEVEFAFPDIGRRVMLLNARRLLQEEDQSALILLALEDITDRKSAEDDIQVSERRYRRLFESARDGILILDPDTRKIVDANPYMEELLGYSHLQLIGKELWEIGLWKDEQASQQAFRELQEQGYIRYEDLPLETVGGAKREVEFVSNRYPEGGHNVIQCNIRDITDRKRTEELIHTSQELRQRALDAAELGSWNIDLESNSLKTDAQWRTIFGVISDEPLEIEQAYELVHADDRQRVRDAVAVALRPENLLPFAEDYRVVHPDGAIRWVSAKGRANFRDEGPQRVLASFDGTVADITQRKQADQELLASNRNKDAFLAMLGHELRNPLSGIVSGVQALKQSTSHDADATELYDIITRQSELMTRLVDDLLDMSRISAGKIRLRRKRVNLVERVAKVVGDHRHHIEQSKLSLSSDFPDSPLWIKGDLTRISQVVKNLLNNATKFTDAGGSISVTIKSAVESDQDMAMIMVRDSGIGMEPSTVATMFEPFRQADTSIARSRGGLGLGMALSKQLVEMHGGSIAVQSEGLGHGSMFTVTLPLSRDQTSPAAPEITPTTKVLTSHRILIVDDQRALRLPMKRLLTSLGQEVVAEADGGTTALAAVREHRPEIVFCDIGLPDMDGYAVAREIRSDPDLSDTFLVAVTGYGQDDDRQLAHEAGFNLHITKPIGLGELRAAIEKFEVILSNQDRQVVFGAKPQRLT